MSTNLTYGYVKPATGDRGTSLFTLLETDIQQLNDHAHNGVDSAFLPPSSIQHFSSTIAAAQWSSDGGGNYSKVVTVPAGISGAATYNDVLTYNIICKINTAGATYGDVIYPQIERESATTFTVRVNDNTLDVIIYYV